MLCMPGRHDGAFVAGSGKVLLEHNVQLTAQRYNVDRAQAQVVQARLFDNPVISLEQNIYNRLTGNILMWARKEKLRLR